VSFVFSESMRIFRGFSAVARSGLFDGKSGCLGCSIVGLIAKLDDCRARDDRTWVIRASISKVVIASDV
jgi:hypothetical protein